MKRTGLAIVALTTLATLLVLWTDAVPLGVPGEWTWGRLNYDADSLALAVTLTVVCGLGVVVFAWLADRRLPVASRIETALWLGGLVLIGLVWLLGVQSATAPGIGLGKGPFVLFYPRFSGYFWHTRYTSPEELERVGQEGFLAAYEDLVAEGDYLHIGTHPPGLMLDYIALQRFFARRPDLVPAVIATMPGDAVNATRQIGTGMHSSGQSFEPADAAVLWAATVLTIVASALTTLPLYFWCRLFSGRQGAFRAALLWLLVPAIAVFAPKSDVLFPLIAMSAAVLWRSAWLKCRLTPAALSGICLWIGLLHTLAFLPVAALMAVQTLLDGRPSDPRQQPQSAWRIALLFAAGFAGLAAPVALLWWTSNGNLLAIWKHNYFNHAAFYDHFTRTWWKWLLVNPLELLAAVGIPVALLCLRPVVVPPGARASLARRSGLLAFGLVWGLLWLSGKNMGEAARLWILLMPWLVATAAANWPAPGDSEAPPSAHFRETGGWLALLALQVVIAAGTTLRIDGFHFGGFE